MSLLRSFVAASALLISVGLQSAAAQDKPIVVGLAIAKTGWMAPYDIPVANAARMAIDEINAKGGLLGRKIEVVESDTKTDQEQGAKAGIEVVEQGSSLVIVSCNHDMGAPAALQANNQNIVTMGCAGDPKYYIGGNSSPLRYAMAINSYSQSITIADWAYERKRLRSAYLLEDQAIDYSRSLCKGFRDYWKTLPDAKFAGEDSFKNDDPSIAAQITRIKGLSTPPDFIYICSYVPGGATAVRQIRAAGIDIPIMGAFGFDGDYWIGSVPNLSNFYFVTSMSTFGDDPDPRRKAFYDEYVKRFGRPEGGWAVYGHAMIEAWARAVEKTGSLDGKAVGAELDKFTDVPLLVGNVTFKPQTKILLRQDLLVMEIQDGKFRTVESYRAKGEPTF